MFAHIVYDRKAFTPIPGAKATGKRAYSPMRRQDMTAANAVDVKSAFHESPGTPDDMIAGLTVRIYTMERNVMIPPLISVGMSEPFSVIPK